MISFINMYTYGLGKESLWSLEEIGGGGHVLEDTVLMGPLKIADK